MQTQTADERSQCLQVEPVPLCPVCDHAGAVIHDALQDHLYHIPGRWRLRRCGNPACGLGWLDPRPTAADIGAAYRSYYTHHSTGASTSRPGSALQSLLMRVKTKALWVSRTRRSRQRLYLDKVTPGRALDIGCGSGILLKLLSDAGWQAEGQEVDPKAARAAERYSGCSVHVGPLDGLSLPAGQFDAVTMSHVIEHVHDPVKLLGQSRDLLRPGGLVVAVTPNMQSLGHLMHGQDWRGLEPPRHLALFSPLAIRRCADRADLDILDIFTTSAFAGYFSFASQDVRERRLGGAVAAASWWEAMRFKVASTMLGASAAGAGEELVMIAARRG